MALIKHLGRVSIPRAYSTFFHSERKHFAAERENAKSAPWLQYLFKPSHMRNHNEDYFLEVQGLEGPEMLPVPELCPRLARRMAEHFKGWQTHVGMTLVSTEMHVDLYPEDIQTVIIIPVIISKHHKLVVESESKALIPGHAYSFNQTREHALAYGDENHLENQRSKASSLITVSFRK